MQLIKNLIRRFEVDEKRKKQLLSAATGALDPILKKIAQELAASVPKESVLRNTAFETAAGVVKGFIEATAEDLPLAAWLSLEKATDLADFFTGALGAKNHQSEIASWMEEFFKEATERLKSAGNPEAELEKLKTEFELRQKLMEKIEGVIKESVTPAQAKSRWQTLFHKLQETYQSKAQSLEETAVKAEDWSKSKKRKRGYKP